jgi:hypothetical protein
MQRSFLEVKKVVYKAAFYTIRVTILLCVLCLCVAPKSYSEEKLTISEVAISEQSFNPTQGEKINISYTLSKNAFVTMKVFDPDLGQVQTIIDNLPRKMGENTESWDGKDIDKNIVPNEAYFFTIEAKDDKGENAVYDPTTFSGGKAGDISNARLDQNTYTIAYKLDEPSRVMIRMGVRHGALLKILTDWSPRIAGENIELWNGKDQDNILNIAKMPKFAMVITYFTLPQNSVITIGNNKFDYRTYKFDIAKDRPIKPERPIAIEYNEKLSPHYLMPKKLDRSPKLKISFPSANEFTKDNLPIFKGNALVRVEIVDEKDREYMDNQQYELTFLVDTEFYAEEEQAYSPYNWVWDLSNVQPGEHILTVNLNSFRDHFGVANRKVIISK